MLLTEKTKKALDKLLLNEGAETKNMKAAKHYLYDNVGYNEQQAMQCIGRIKTDIPNSRLGKCKFMLAMVRMFHQGELNDGQTIMNVNKSLKYAASDAHINEYNQNLNGLTAQQLTQRFSGVAQQDLEQDKNDISSQQYDENNSQYEIVKINSFEEAEEYGYYVSWCVTQDEEMYQSYTNNGEGVFYFCLRNGWEDEEEIKGQNCPLDNYGLSMIAVSINGDGSCNTITCRWNHDNNGNDNIMTPKQLSQVINRNFYNVFKPLTKEEQERNKQQIFYEINEEIDMELQYNELDDFCNSLYCDKDEGNTDERVLYVYSSQKGYVILDEQGNLIINEIFDDVHNRIGDIFVVRKNNKYNFINMDGKLISQTWFDKVSNLFDDDMGMVYLKTKNKWSLINRNGELILPWCDAICDSIYNSMKGSDVIEILNNGKWDYVNLNNGGYSIFNEDIAYIETMPSGVDNKFKSWRLIKFDGYDYYELFDMMDGYLVSSYKFDGNVGVCHGMPYLTLKGNNQQFYAIDLNGNMYLYNSNAKNGSKEQFTPVKPQQQMDEYKQRKVIFITEEQAKNLEDIFNDPMFDNVKQFDINFLKQNKWKNGTELIHYCDMCNLLCLGEGASRKVYQINDETVLKIEKDTHFNSDKQNEKEVQSFRNCDNEMKQFVPNIIDYDKNNLYPLWIVAEQVLPASYADFQKLLGIDFGYYTSKADIEQMKQDLQDYSKYDGKKADCFSLNLMDFLEAYGEGDLSLYQSDIYNNKWLQKLLKLLDNGIVNYWELEVIRNWGLVKRNGMPTLVILDIGI